MQQEPALKQAQTFPDLARDAFPEDGYPVASTKLDAIVRVILMGVYDDDHPLSVFRGMRYLIQAICELTKEFNRVYYALDINTEYHKNVLYTQWQQDRYSKEGTEVAFRRIDHIQTCYFPHLWHKEPRLNFDTLALPEPLQKPVNINMMPVRMKYSTIQDQLPAELRGYVPWIKACIQSDSSLLKTVCYVTIHESFVRSGRTQRRPGLHCEHPGAGEDTGIEGNTEWDWAWGGGYAQRDGIYMASNVSTTCAVWNCTVGDDAIGHLGSLEHVRAVLPNERRYELEGGKLYWLTDRTPHEVLPMKQDGWRQFFRLVSSKLSVWYEQHSTKNPLGVVPDKNITRIITENKFENKSKTK